MRNFSLLIFFVLLTACGGGGSKSEHVDPQPVNKTPQVSISGNSETPSLTAIRLNTSISDPENENVTVKWSSSLSDVTFKDQSDLGVLVQFPAVTTDQEVTLTLEVTDSANNKVMKTFIVMVKTTSNQVDIDLQDKYEFFSGDSVEITAKFSSSEEITDVEWQTDELELANKQVTTQESNNSGSSIVTFTAPTLASKYSYTLNFVVTTDHDEYSKPFELTILPKSEAGLTINIDASYDVNEQDYLLIDPKIQSSERITSYQWRWLGISLGELVNTKNKTVTIKANEVSDDTSAILVLDVETQSGEKKSVQTEVKVKNAVQVAKLSLSVNRAYAAPGQEVVVSVDTDSADDIQSFEWVIDEEIFKQKEESATELSLVMPSQNTSLVSTLVQYKVTFKNGLEAQKNAVFALLSESATKATLDIEQPSELPQLFKNEPLTFNALVVDRAGVLDSVSLDVSNVSYVDLDNSTLTQDGLNLSFTLKASDILLDRELMLRVVMSAGTVSTTEYVSVNLNKSNLKLFAGSEKTYISGSDFYVFGYGQERLNNPINTMSWSTNYDDLAIETLNSTVAKITNKGTSGFRIVTLSTQDSEDQLIQADVKTNMTSRIYDKGEGYTCYFRTDEVLCRDNSNTLLDVGELAAPVKAGVTKGEFVCLLNNDDQLSCHGEGPLSVLEVPERAGVANIVAVSNSDMCAQYSSGNWHCWGEQADYFNNLFVGKSHIDNLIGTQQGVCLVNSGYIECYNDKSELIYQDKRSFVKSLEFVNILNKVCYTTERSTLRTCPDEIN
jgi:streptomycin 6-kinase